jgi:hypothetical protein
LRSLFAFSAMFLAPSMAESNASFPCGAGFSRMRAGHLWRRRQSRLSPLTAERLRFARDHDTPAFRN